MSKKPKTFEEAIALLGEGEDSICYDVKIGHRVGDLMSRKTWLESVKCLAFIDYDGYGTEVTKHGNLCTDISPSRAHKIHTPTAYILWYNR